MKAKRRAFVNEYVKDWNGTRAAIRAGYTVKNARQAGSELLTFPDVQAAIEARLAKLEITADSVLQELRRIGFANMLDYIQPQTDGSAYVDFSKLTREQAAAIQEVTVEEYTEGGGEESRNVKRVRFKLADKKSSLELLGKHLGMFKGAGSEDDPIRVVVEHIGSAHPATA